MWEAIEGWGGGVSLEPAGSSCHGRTGRQSTGPSRFNSGVGGMPPVQPQPPVPTLLGKVGLTVYRSVYLGSDRMFRKGLLL